MVRGFGVLGSHGFAAYESQTSQMLIARLARTVTNIIIRKMPEKTITSGNFTSSALPEASRILED